MIEELVGKRIILRKAKVSDLESMYYNVWSNNEIAKYMFWEKTNSYEAAIDRLNRSIEFQKNNFAYFIALNSTDEAIGFCGIKKEGNTVFETGICIAEQYQNQGLGSEVLEVLLKLAFNVLNANNFIYACMIDNVRSEKMCLKYGFKYLETKKEIRKWDGEELMINYYELSLTDYKR